MIVDEVDSATVTDDVVDAWHTVFSDAQHELHPSEPRPVREWVDGLMRNPGTFAPFRLWLAWSDDRSELYGGAETYWLKGANPHVVDVQLWVHEPARRRGAGRALLDEVRAAAKADGRTSLHGGAPVDGAGYDFAVAMGGRAALEEFRHHALLGELDTSLLEPRTVDGIRILRWIGHAPDDVVEPFARLRAVMNTAPLGTLDLNDDSFDVARLRDWEAVARARGRQIWTVAAQDEQTGELVGFTEVIIVEASPAKANQDDTGVMPAYRGRGIAQLVKTDMLRWLQAERPQLRVLTTWNAVTNGPMLAVNDRLGYTDRQRWATFVIDV